MCGDLYVLRPYAFMACSLTIGTTLSNNSWSSSISEDTDRGTEDRGSNLGRDWDTCLHPTSRLVLDAHLASYQMVTGLSYRNEASAA